MSNACLPCLTVVLWSHLNEAERDYIIEQMKVIACKIDYKDSENKKWIKGMAVVGGVIALAGIAVLGVAVGGAFAAKTPDMDPPEPEPEPDLDNFDNII